MKILLSHRYFWPDTAPYAPMLRAIGDALAAAGHEVHVHAGRPSYRDTGEEHPKNELLDRLHVHRGWVFRGEKRNPALRLANVFLYCWGLFWRILRLRPDVVTAAAFPPVVAAWTASLAARIVGARFVYHLQDIHPEVSQVSGGALGRGLPFRLLCWLDNRTLRRAATIVVLSQDMADTLHARVLGDLPIHVINNFSLGLYAADAEPPEALRKMPGRRRAIFAGNLGRFQNLPLLAEGVARCFDRHPDLDLFFLGDGTALPELKAKWGDHPQVRFAPFLPFAQARPLIAEADVGLVSLAPGVYRVSYPSKVLTYSGLGLPMLALVEPQSALARDLHDSSMGAVPAAATPEAVARALGELLKRPAETPRPPDPGNDIDRKLAIWVRFIEDLRP